mmetsp:Transcript_59516/g.126527  ORF Transcript_59516/g.126527 Transcript_59516/m.126527 type:complete len:233 (+) Transcript_59516:161-859(+)|eukprot:CAMPEP_0172551364 /NCGR_PEP_ID=MMETSP1067-20121228/38626_1 /TAXON_ID=265564 ORGANISM="Thalassiosira punctigera, Strain Tpunct2005C2" /NCGR_SAMPLE_ID=MMETSP1067 /ASSEMBLY_ACC=CAM_ASM_000444 /LENGTH=232 /DNA_ID=CAMNT_0013339147 /DNA_START=161 /DNA_END=859 /DNA_ORIENTATION=-
MSIAWSCVARDGIILAEAGSDDGKGSVVRTAQRISRMKPTAGWEKTHSWKDAPFKGIKFHLHEAADAEDDFHQSDKIIIWTFSCVYDSKKISEECVKAFLTKILYVTEALRGMPWWREGATLSAQASFAPTLQQQMETADRTGKMSMMNQHVEETKAIMASNIENVLERGERLEDLEDEARQLNEMSRVFKKKSKDLKRFHMWQNAKHGVMVGTAVTGAVGAIVIPPLIALL